ncbi:MAG: T3SS effector HopA1 family protein [Nostoc sp. DedQUE12a]|nr:T3SS effector HopA1 family protein [Nostoc sp. DedQUE12a]
MIAELLEINPNQSTEADRRLWDALEDIVNNVEIESDFCIRHPNYKPLDLPEEVIVRFKKMSQDVQNRYSNLQLRSFLYGIYYNGSLQTTLALDGDSSYLQLHQDLENNSFLGVDLAFYDRLHNSNTGEGYFDANWSVVKQVNDDTLMVTKGGLNLYIKRDYHLQPAEQSAVVGDLVAIRLPKNRVQNGFYLAVGNAGPQTIGNPNHQPQTVRIYFNLTPEGAVAVMGSLTQQLNEINIPFTFKALYNPADYGRYDSAVLYFEKSYYEAVRPILQSVYTEKRCLRRALPTHFNPEVPLFTKLLKPGLSLAEEPNQRFAAQESFGINRCQIIANGLLQARQQGNNSPKERMKAILENFSLLGIELHRSYLNANSEDIYTPLN